MASLTEIRTGIKSVIKANISNLNVYSEVADVAQVPAIVIMPALDHLSGGMVCDYDGAFKRGMDTWHMDLSVLVARTETSLAQVELDKYISGTGPRSIRRVIYENSGLGLTDGTDAHASGVRLYGGKFNAAQIDHVGAVVRLIVRTTSA
ncbi:hypothetical protein [Streptomyces sp. NPDC059009]|uniref:hypothetical protein n=1 Tax=Streptomyces sp. NPDC059009 TaxID=3346694 RepID=UPI0036748961